MKFLVELSLEELDLLSAALFVTMEAAEWVAVPVHQAIFLKIDDALKRPATLSPPASEGPTAPLPAWSSQRMSAEEQTTLVTRATKDLHLEIARKWGFPANVMAAATFGLGVTMMYESGCTEGQIVEFVRQLVGDLTSPPDERGAS